MPGISFNPQQQQAIQEYRQQNNLGYVLSDEAVVQEMIKNGKLPSCFGALGQPVSTEAKPPAQNSPANSHYETSFFTAQYQTYVAPPPSISIVLIQLTTHNHKALSPN